MKRLSEFGDALAGWAVLAFVVVGLYLAGRMVLNINLMENIGFILSVISVFGWFFWLYSLDMVFHGLLGKDLEEDDRYNLLFRLFDGTAGRFHKYYESKSEVMLIAYGICIAISILFIFYLIGIPAIASAMALVAEIKEVSGFPGLSLMTFGWALAFYAVPILGVSVKRVFCPVEA